MKMIGDSLPLFFNSFVINYLPVKFNVPFVFLQVYFFCGVAFFLIFKEILCALCDTLCALCVKCGVLCYMLPSPQTMNRRLQKVTGKQRLSGLP
jgi:hypothetical protein